MYLKRLFYFFYYLKKLDWQLFNKSIGYVNANYGMSRMALWYDLFLSSLKYNISILEYFQFRFFEISKKEKEGFAGTGYMYEYQLAMNPKESRQILADKVAFNAEYCSFINHDSASFEVLTSDPSRGENFLNSNDKIVLKDSLGQCGVGISVIKSFGLTRDKLVSMLEKSDNDMVEGYIEQHKDLASISSSGLNTVRIITQLSKDDNVDYLGARLRITVNSIVDNLAKGNLAAPINIETGKVNGPAVYSDVTKDDEEKHPITGTKITGFQVPFWDEVLIMTCEAALFNKKNRSIGWDVAITDNGPELLEGNHDWCKLLWQLPVKKGLKKDLEPYRKGLK